jgi:hypothetical protein
MQGTEILNKVIKMCSFLVGQRRFAILRNSAGNKRLQIVVISESKYNR